FTDEEQLYQTIDRIVAQVNRRVDESSPMVDARRDARAAGRPVVRLHLQNRWAGLTRLLDAARGDI
ncbi:hypothetical protein, partial [Actinomadura luteofluorescens]